MILGLVLVLGVAYLLFIGPGKQLLISLGVLGGMAKEAQEFSDNNFNALSQKISSCQAMKDSNCLCEIFPSWPATFAKDSVLVIKATGKDTLLEWKYNNKVYRTQIISNLFLSAKEIETKQDITFSSTKNLNWKSEPPTFEQEGLGSKGFLGSPIGKKEYKVVSSSVYKTENGLYLLISRETQNKLSELEPMLSAIKKCSS